MGEFVEMPGAKLFKELGDQVLAGESNKIDPPTSSEPEIVELPEELPNFPILHRKQIINKMDAARNLVGQALCHLTHICDTYKKSGNLGHYDMAAAIIVALDAGLEMLEEQYKIS